MARSRTVTSGGGVDLVADSVATVNVNASYLMSAAGDIRPGVGEAWLITALAGGGQIQFTDGANDTADGGGGGFPQNEDILGLQIFITRDVYAKTAASTFGVAAGKIIDITKVKSAILTNGATLRPPSGEIWYITFIYTGQNISTTLRMTDGTNVVTLNTSMLDAAISPPIKIDNSTYIINNSGAGNNMFISAWKAYP